MKYRNFMCRFTQIIQSPNPPLYFLERNFFLSLEEIQQFYDWLLKKSETSDLLDIKALALCRMKGAVHKPNSLPLSSIQLSYTFPKNKILDIISEQCQTTNQEVFLIGGCVRDLLLSKEFIDIDCCLETSPNSFVEDLMQKHGGHCDKNPSFGSAHWHMLSGDIIDFTQTREEIYPQKGHLPEVTPCDLTTDLQRRDFTINAMAIPLHTRRKGESIDRVTLELIDPFQGQANLKSQLLRILHPLSFWDDPTRIFRGARYAGRYDLQCTPMTQHALDFALSDITLGQDITWQRIGNEFQNIFLERSPILAWQKLQDWRVIQEWFPSLSKITPLLQKIEEATFLSPEEKLDSYWSTFSLSFTPEERNQQLGMVSQRSRLRKIWVETPLFFEKIQENIELINDHGSFAEIIQKATPAQILALSLFFPQLRFFFDWWRKKGSQIICTIRGKDLLKLGCPKGPLVGRALSAAKRAAWNDYNFDEQIQAAQRIWLEATP